MPQIFSRAILQRKPKTQSPAYIISRPAYSGTVCSTCPAKALTSPGASILQRFEQRFKPEVHSLDRPSKGYSPGSEKPFCCRANPGERSKRFGSSTYCMDLNHDQTLHILMGLPTAFSASIVTSNLSWKKFLTPGPKRP